MKITKNRVNQTHSVMNKPKDKKNILDIIQNLKSSSSNTSKTQLQKRKIVALPQINASANLERIPISIWQQNSNNSVFYDIKLIWIKFILKLQILICFY